MKVIFYANQKSAHRKRLLRVVELLVTSERIESHLTVESLEKRLHKHIIEPVVFLILVCNMQELLQLLEIKAYMYDRKLIIILPDEDRDTISKSHELRPRYTSYTESDFSDVAVVLGKMLAHAIPVLHDGIDRRYKSKLRQNKRISNEVV